MGDRSRSPPEQRAGGPVACCLFSHLVRSIGDPESIYQGVVSDPIGDQPLLPHGIEETDGVRPLAGFAAGGLKCVRWRGGEREKYKERGEGCQRVR